MGAESASTTRNSLFPWSQEFRGQSERWRWRRPMPAAFHTPNAFPHLDFRTEHWEHCLQQHLPTVSMYFIIVHQLPFFSLQQQHPSLLHSVRVTPCVCVCILIAIITDIVYTLFHWKQYFNRIKCASMFPRFYREREREREQLPATTTTAAWTHSCFE